MVQSKCWKDCILPLHCMTYICRENTFYPSVVQLPSLCPHPSCSSLPLWHASLFHLARGCLRVLAEPVTPGSGRLSPGAYRDCPAGVLPRPGAPKGSGEEPPLKAHCSSLHGCWCKAGTLHICQPQLTWPRPMAACKYLPPGTDRDYCQSVQLDAWSPKPPTLTDHGQ